MFRFLKLVYIFVMLKRNKAITNGATTDQKAMNWQIIFSFRKFQCAEQAQLPHDQILTCYSSETAIQLQLDTEAKTKQLAAPRPMLAFVPTIVYNHVIHANFLYFETLSLLFQSQFLNINFCIIYRNTITPSKIDHYLNSEKFYARRFSKLPAMLQSYVRVFKHFFVFRDWLTQRTYNKYKPQAINMLNACLLAS